MAGYPYHPAWANNQAAQYQQHEIRQQQPPDLLDEDYFCPNVSPRGSNTHSRNPSYAGSANSFLSAPGYLQGQGQQSRTAAVVWDGLPHRPHRIRPPDNNEPEDASYNSFSRDVDILSTSQARPDNAGHHFGSANPRPGAVNAYQVDPDHLTEVELDPNLHPQADPRAPSWNPYNPRTPPKEFSEKFPAASTGNGDINRNLLWANYGRAEPSSTAPTQADYATHLSPPNVPPTLDGVSNCNRSDISETWSCHRCKNSLGDPRSLRRHLKEVHREDAKPPYQCACGRDTTRLWNHLRHVKGCKKKRRYGHFICWCGLLHSTQHEHQVHVTECGKEKAGRRPRTADTYNSQTRVQ